MQHSHEHEHTHTHVHEPKEEQSKASVTDEGLLKTKALLSYMVQHNEQHAQELADLLDSLPKNAGKKLLLAIGTFEAANVQLKEILDIIE